MIHSFLAHPSPVICPGTASKFLCLRPQRQPVTAPLVSLTQYSTHNRAPLTKGEGQSRKKAPTVQVATAEVPGRFPGVLSGSRGRRHNNRIGASPVIPGEPGVDPGGCRQPGLTGNPEEGNTHLPAGLYLKAVKQESVTHIVRDFDNLEVPTSLERVHRDLGY